MVVLPAPGVPVSIMAVEGVMPSPEETASSNQLRPVFTVRSSWAGTSRSRMLVPRFQDLRPTERFMFDIFASLIGLADFINLSCRGATLHWVLQV